MENYPAPENVPDAEQIWRYMSFAGFVAMLNHSSLILPSLRKQEDKWEGVVPRCVLDWVESKTTVQWRNSGFSSYGDYFRTIEIPRHYASCWHRNQFESSAMWQRYGNEAIAVVTSVGCLRSFLEECSVCYGKTVLDRMVPINVGSVEYIDHNHWQPPSTYHLQPFQAFFYKRLSFAYEREYRAVIDASDDFPDPRKYSASAIRARASDRNRLFNLFKGVYVSPYAKAWFADLVKETLDNYGCQHAERLVIQTDPTSDLYM
ncbi:MAG: hypothetical protein J5I93_03540 [Pirellulaceae bacterium]|nr:hypothetical protein [Pirellulaceae bacterium]